ncbi:MAG TPA: NUDIX hydrolase [Bryobacterales bacterium]|nr:NUDIX hydrolase [Bryobacterales bacterium]
MKVTSSAVLLHDSAFDVTLDRAVGPTGRIIEKHVLKHPGAVVVLARNASAEVLLIRQYRLPLRKAIWELPAGKVDRHEPRLRTAKRELAEETGYRARHWRKLLEFHPAPGFCDERMTAYLAQDLTAGKAKPEPYEVIRPRWFAWDEVLEMIRRGRIHDAKTIATVLFVERFGQPA